MPMDKDARVRDEDEEPVKKALDKSARVYEEDEDLLKKAEETFKRNDKQ